MIYSFRVTGTGTGKTLSFVLPLNEKLKDIPRKSGRPPTVMALAPTRELAKQVSQAHLYPIVLLQGFGYFLFNSKHKSPQIYIKLTWFKIMMVEKLLLAEVLWLLRT